MTARPPELARLLLRWCAPSELSDAMTADLDEEFHSYALPQRGARAARRWYWTQVAISAPICLWERLFDAVTRALPLHTERGELAQDLRFAVRTVLGRPGFSCVVVFALALGIGGTTLAYGVVDGLVLHPFPYPDPDRLVAIGVENVSKGAPLRFGENVSPPEFIDVRASSRTLESFFAFDHGPSQLQVDDRSLPVLQGIGWGDIFETLGVTPHIGRGFALSEMEPEGAELAVLSHRLWTTEFGADSSVLGRSVEISREPHTVVGVMPPGILLDEVDLWTPAGSPPALRPRGPRRLFQILARIRPGYSIRDVDLEMATVSAAIAAEHGVQYPEYEGWRLRASTWAEANVQDYKALGFLMFAGVTFLLLLVCINLTGLYLASATRRGRELAVRQSLGAGSLRIARLLVMESLVAGLVGGALGALIAVLGSGAVNRLLTSMPEVVGQVVPSMALLLVALAVSIAAGLLTGLVPAIQLARNDVGAFLRTEGPGATAAPAALRAQHKLVAIEMALALILLVGTGAVASSFLRLSSVDLGIDPSHLLSARFDVLASSPRATAVFYEELENRVAELTGVLATGVSFRTPAHGVGMRSVALDRSSGIEQGELPLAQVTYSSPGYSELLGRIPKPTKLTRGRKASAKPIPSHLRIRPVKKICVNRVRAWTTISITAKSRV